MEFFKDINGKMSGKRIFGCFAAVIAAVTTFTSGDYLLVGVWVAAATTAFGLSVRERSQ